MAETMDAADMPGLHSKLLKLRRNLGDDFSPDSDSYRVLTSNRGGGRRTTLADWTWQQSAIAGCSGRGAIAGAMVGCHCSALWFGGRATTNFGEWTWRHCWVPLKGAIVVRYGCGGRVTTNFGGVDVVPLQGAIVVCCGWVPVS